ncbi:unnamed protein product [Gulo gulo]|uniref:Uncharacterized protein n=1 Tax=Gulo gulo TaxID=48420 RepID=A0A9X9LEV1_GULGU|nr:unnamed protein product [Gulo gulo]
MACGHEGSLQPHENLPPAEMLSVWPQNVLLLRIRDLLTFILSLSGVRTLQVSAAL